MPTKSEIDQFFTQHDKQIEAIINASKSNCKLPNKENIKTDLYLLCVEKRESISDLNLNWIKYLAATEYRWTRSKSNQINSIFASETEAANLDIECEEYQEPSRDWDFLSAKYLVNAKPSEKIFFNLYVSQGIRTVRGVSKKLSISHRSAWVLIREFKKKMKSYER